MRGSKVAEAGATASFITRSLKAVGRDGHEGDFKAPTTTAELFKAVSCDLTNYVRTGETRYGGGGSILVSYIASDGIYVYNLGIQGRPCMTVMGMYCAVRQRSLIWRWMNWSI